jgi:hypothetical protein
VVAGTVTSNRLTVGSAGARFLLPVAVSGSALGLLVAALQTGLSLLTWGFTVCLGLLAMLATIAWGTLRGPIRPVCEIRRLRLVDKGGRQVDCELRGAVVGLEPGPGDHLQVRGKRDRHGILRVRRVLVTVTGAGATPRPRIRYLLARAVNPVAAILAAAVTLLAFFLYADFG